MEQINANTLTIPILNMFLQVLAAFAANVRALFPKQSFHHLCSYYRNSSFDS